MNQPTLCELRLGRRDDLILSIRAWSLVCPGPASLGTISFATNRELAPVDYISQFSQALAFD
ncbi:hypothetical protein ACFL34_02650 [Candidatus Sumerlaeota bacterium]